MQGSSPCLRGAWAALGGLGSVNNQLEGALCKAPSSACNKKLKNEHKCKSPVISDVP